VITIENLIPTIFKEMSSDGDNESKALFDYYQRCNTPEQAVINDVMIYLTGWSFETLMEKAKKADPIY
jgi:hypothetical protein